MKRSNKIIDLAGTGSQRRTRRIVMLAFPDAQVIDITGPLEVFGRAARLLIDERGWRIPAYTVEIAAAKAGPFATSSGIRLIADRSIARVRGSIDTLLVAGGQGTAAALRDRKLIDWLRASVNRARRLCSVCTGAFLLAEAGLLDGLSATTHWRQCDRLAARYPAVSVETDPIFVRAGKIFTSAGVTAGIDLALALLEDDHGREVALAVARELVMFLRRPGGQSQFSVQLSAQQADREPLRDLQRWIADHLGSRLVGRSARAARRDEPAQLRPRVHARSRHDAGRIRRELARRSGAPPPGGIRRRRRLDRVCMRLWHARVDAPRLYPHATRAAQRIPQPL